MNKNSAALIMKIRNNIILIQFGDLLCPRIPPCHHLQLLQPQPPRRIENILQIFSRKERAHLKLHHGDLVVKRADNGVGFKRISNPRLKLRIGALHTLYNAVVDGFMDQKTTGSCAP